MNDLATQSLDLVSHELAATMDSAREQLEAFVDGQAGPEGLMRCAELLHLAAGALKIVEAHGAALLAEEMQEACHFLGAARDQEIVDDGLETLTRSMVQLPAYIDRLLAGGRDVALILLPLINDLRELTKRPTLSEGTLVLLSSGSRGRFVVATSTAEVQADTIDETDSVNLSGLRPLFQAALLGWIRGDATARQLEQLIDVSRQLERAVNTEAGRQLWYVLTAVLEAVREAGLEETVALKRLVGQADRQLKRLIDDGERSFVASPPVELLNGLLYYVGHASGDNERLAELRRSYDLDELVPAAEQLAEARSELAGPNAKLMGTVADAIRDDLSGVKDALDIFVRTGMEDAGDLAPQLEMLKKIGDTLGVLGLAQSRDAIREQSKRLKVIVADGSVAEPSALDEIAATLLSVEDALDKELVDAVAPVAKIAESEESEADENYKRVTKTTLGECIVNLSHVKETIVHLVDEPGDVRFLDHIEPQLQGITAGLLMLGKTRAVEVVEGIGAVIEARMGGVGVALDAAELERLADAIVSVEYYMETLASGRSDPGYMLDNAERCLEAISTVTATAMTDVPAEPGEVAAEARDDDETIVATEQPESVPERVPAVMQIGEEPPDPELVELFIEEAKEELAQINRLLPLWRDNLDRRDELVAVRRSFHTLKGSGRVVGAEFIGEFCWRVEKILNRIINRTLPVTEPMLTLITDATAALPQLIEQLEFGTEPRADIQRLMENVESIAATGSEAVLANETMQMHVLDGPELQQHEVPPEPDASMDPVLAEIFAKESRGHLEVVREQLAEFAAASAPYPIDEGLFRACHTLLGSATMAAFAPLVAVVEPLDAYIGAQFKSKAGISAEGLTQIQRALTIMQDMISALEANEPFDADAADLIAALERLATTAAPAELVDAVTDIDSVPEPSVRARDFDPEIAAIFSEEASEILDSAELALQDFRRDAGRTDQLAELQRLLHTLKGGARMAGLPVMGELSHSLEDLLSAMAAGSLTPSPDAVDVVQQSLDYLHELRDSIASGREAPPPAALLARLAAVASGSEDAAAEPAAGGDFAALAGAFADDDDVADDEPPSADGFELEEVSLDDVETVIEAAPEFGQFDDDAEETGLDIGASLEALGTLTFSPDDLESFDQLAAAGTGGDDVALAVTGADELAVSPMPDDERGDVAQTPTAAAELVRVDAELLDALLNGVGEISIFQSRLAQQASNLEFNLGELDETVVRLREQLRQFEAETEAQILHRHQDDAEVRGDFDPLELDRYSKIQQLSRALAETANDVASINDLLRGLSNETTTLLTQQARVATSVQDGLMQTRMVPFERYVPRLARIVRQACADTGKRAELEIYGAHGELDRQVIEQMLAPLEHLLRNAAVHGIEDAAERGACGKPEIGHIDLSLKRDGSEVIIEVADDGSGLDIDAIRAKARELDLLGDDRTTLADQDIIELILRPGFTTATEVTQAAGRGVGLDVVENQVKKLGGSLRIESEPAKGTRFVLRLPYTLAVTHALIVNVGEETFALPLPTVEGITRVPKDRLLELLTEDEPVLEHSGINYRLQHLGSFVGAAPSSLPDDDSFVSLVLVRAGDNSTALLTDSLEGSREVVVKTLGPHLTGIPGVSGATILGDGRIIVILDVGTLIRTHKDGVEVPQPAVPVETPEQTTALVVDDSITMRRVTQRLLERHGARVLTARDGMDAITVLQDQIPDIILLDIEMPRMDGYQFATYVRKNADLKDVPIIMITSRAGEKHRARAIEIGVNDYLSKPYQEDQLLGAIESLLGRVL